VLYFTPKSDIISLIQMKKSIAIILLTLILFFSFPHPTLAANISCDTNLSPAATLNAIGTLIKSGLTLGTADVITSFLKGLPVIGGAFEPFDETVSFLYGQYLNSLLYGSLASLAVYLIGSLVQFALVINANLTTDNYIISAGYGVIYELVTFGFVVGIIIIAFATMLRRSDWDAKSALVRLIIAALLINFSLFFAGLLLNVSTKITEVLITNACTGKLLVEQFNFITLSDKISLFIGTMNGGVAEQAIKSIIAVFFAGALSIIGALSLLGIFIYLMIRYVSVIILLIFMPIAWLGFVFPSLDIPGLGNAWKGWWKDFTKWIIYGPLMAFFMYLTATMISGFTDPNNQLIVSNAGQGVQAIGQLFVVVMLSLGSLYAAKEISGVGSGLILAGVGGAAVFAANRTQNLLKKAQFSALRQANKLGRLKDEGKSTPWQDRQEKLFRAGGQTFGAFSKPAFQGPLRSVLTSAGLNLKGQQEDMSLNAFNKKRIADASEKLKDSTSDEIAEGVKEMKEFKGIKADEPEFIASLQELTKRGDLDKIKDLDKVLNSDVENGFKDYNLKFKDVEIGIGMNVASYKTMKNEEEIINASERLKDLTADEIANRMKGIKNDDPKFIASLQKLKELNGLTVNETVNGMRGLKNDDPKFIASLQKLEKLDNSDNYLDKEIKKAMEVQKTFQGELQKFYGGLAKKDLPKLPINNIYAKYDENKPLFGLDEASFNRFRSSTTEAILANPGDLNKNMPNIKPKNIDNYVKSILRETLPKYISVETPSAETSPVVVQQVVFKEDSRPAFGVSLEAAKKDPEKFDIKSVTKSVAKSVIKTITQDEAISDYTNGEINKAIMKYYKNTKPEIHKPLSKMFNMRETGLTPSMDTLETEESTKV